MSKIKLLSLSEAAKQLGVSTMTLRRWDSSGKISVVRTPGGQRRVSIEEIERLSKSHTSKSIIRCCIYVRVKSKKEAEKGILVDKQKRLIWEAAKLGYKITHLITEIGSCVKKTRPELKKLLDLATQNQFDILLINDKEIFLPLMFEYFEHLLTLQGITVIPITPEKSVSEKEYFLDLLKYLVKILPLLNTKEEKRVLLKEYFSKSIKLLS